ncbi:hypothetical protein VCUG_02614 [Vavraia culicis subsp. floridensis]|uniref:Ras-GEF domain-containing protein n=1 Tax=Vavraia culicis (isolate floridensis) TaxID=948595 RepID=L2GQL5_VAVCU|nr:uncharacterized protein VCUG_02614 [Vavraia culicis subsp. floridensis]ELA45899.1 hypothetical protein VCUG_02614 [Vavraia culicis subsp. floridensis]
MFLILSLCSCACWNGSSNQDQNKETNEAYIAQHNLYDNSSIEELCNSYLGEADVDKQERNSVTKQRDLTGHTSTESIPSSIANDILDMMQMSESHVKSYIPLLSNDAENCTGYSDRTSSHNLEATRCLKRRREERVQPMLIQQKNSVGPTAGDYTVVSQAKTATSVYEPQNKYRSGSLLQSQTLHPDQVQPPHLEPINSPYPSRASYSQFETTSPSHLEPIDLPTTEHSADPKNDTEINYDMDPEIQRIMQFMQKDKNFNKGFSPLLDTYKYVITDEHQSASVYQRYNGPKEKTCTQLNMRNTLVQNFSWNIYEHAHQVQDIMDARLQSFGCLCGWFDGLEMITRQKCFKSLFMMGYQVEALCESYNRLKREVYILLCTFHNFDSNIAVFNAVMVFTFEKMHGNNNQKHKNIIAAFSSTRIGLRTRMLIIARYILSIGKAISVRIGVLSGSNVTNGASTRVQMPKWQQTEEVANDGSAGTNQECEMFYRNIFIKPAYDLMQEVKRENVRLQEATNHLLMLLTYDDDPTT